MQRTYDLLQELDRLCRRREKDKRLVPLSRVRAAIAEVNRSMREWEKR